MIDQRKIKRARLDNIVGQETISQMEHVGSAGAKLVMSGALVPGRILDAAGITAATASGGVLVGVGNILRIQVAGDTFIQFSNIDQDADDSPLTSAPDANTSPALKVPVAAPGPYHIVVATGNFMRCSAAPTRVEIIEI